MKRILLLLIIYYMTVLTAARAQFHGQVVDATDGYGIPYATLTAADGHHSSVCDGDGFFTLSDSISGVVKVTAVGYGELTLKVSQLQPDMKIELKASVQHLKEVTIKAHRRRYHRKGNPAVELMRRVIAAKKRTELTNHDYYQYVKYQKLTFADSQPDSMKHGHQQWWRNQLEVSPYNGKTVLPFIVNETLTQHIYREDPRKERNNELFSMMRNMEFINDRYVFWDLSWDMNGKLPNRIPLLKHLKWREFFAVNYVRRLSYLDMHIRTATAYAFHS